MALVLGEPIAVLLADNTRLLVRAPDDLAKQQWLSEHLVTAVKQLPAKLEQKAVLIEKINGEKASSFYGAGAFVKAGVPFSVGSLRVRLANL